MLGMVESAATLLSATERPHRAKMTSLLPVSQHPPGPHPAGLLSPETPTSNALEVHRPFRQAALPQAITYPVHITTRAALLSRRRKHTFPAHAALPHLSATRCQRSHGAENSAPCPILLRRPRCNCSARYEKLPLPKARKPAPRPWGIGHRGEPLCFFTKK